MTPYLKILEKISKPHWFEIIRLIKCSPGLSVGELAEKMDMSYMGVKKHCLAMQKLGYLDTWRRPKEVGRPEKTYRVTDKLAPLFPAIGNEVSLSLLEAATQLEPNAAEKLLFTFFLEQTEEIASRMGGGTLREKAESLASIRAKMGYFSSCDPSGGEEVVIDEHHNPLQPLFDRYPTLAKMEAQMFERLLGAAVKRSYSKVSGLTHYRFEITPR